MTLYEVSVFRQLSHSNKHICICLHDGYTSLAKAKSGAKEIVLRNAESGLCSVEFPATQWGIDWVDCKDGCWEGYSFLNIFKARITPYTRGRSA